MTATGRLRSTVDSLRRVPRTLLFSSRTEEPRSRRATDLIVLIASVTGLVLISWMAAPPPGFERALFTLADAVPTAFADLWVLLVDAFAFLAAYVFLAALIRRRTALLRDLLVAAALALGLSLVVGRVVLGSWPAVADSFGLDGFEGWVPSVRLAVPGAVVMTASPNLSRPVRRLGRWTTVLAALGLVLADLAPPGAAVAGLLVATATAAAVHLLFGSSRGRPGLPDVAAALEELGVGARSLGVADRQRAGVFLVDGEDEEGEPLVVKVYGRDAQDTRLLMSIWRTVWYREAGAPTSFRSLPQVEHEAFLTLLAGQEGVLTHRVVTAGATAADDVVLVLRPVGTPLEDAQDRWTFATVSRTWEAVDLLHDAGIAHGQLDDQHIVVDGEAIGLVDLSGGTVAPGRPGLLTDDAQVLVTSALGVGPEAALAGALDARGPEGLAALLPFVQVNALTSRQRSQVKQAGLDLDQMRARAAVLADITPPELQKMRRVTTGTLVQTGLFVLAFIALAAGLGDLDFEAVAESFGDARWGYIAAGALLAQTPRVSQAVSTLGASPIPIALGPLYALQLAITYIGLAVPSAAGRVAMNIRFFQRHGLSSGAALAVGAIDSFAGFIVQICLLVGILLATPSTLDVDLDSASPSGIWRLLVIVVLVGLAAVVLVLVVPKWRRFVFGWISTLLRQGLDAAKGLKDPRRLALLFGGNLVSELLFATALGLFVRGFGFEVGLAELILINVTVALFAGIIPVPGGIGVVEGGLTYGLVRAGMPEESAFAAAICYRLAVFYLPPIWGFFAFRWLERNQHL